MRMHICTDDISRAGTGYLQLRRVCWKHSWEESDNYKRMSTKGTWIFCWMYASLPIYNSEVAGNIDPGYFLWKNIAGSGNKSCQKELVLKPYISNVTFAHQQITSLASLAIYYSIDFLGNYSSKKSCALRVSKAWKKNLWVSWVLEHL